jgi:hypothetical protein
MPHFRVPLGNIHSDQAVSEGWIFEPLQETDMMESFEMGKRMAWESSPGLMGPLTMGFGSWAGNMV